MKLRKLTEKEVLFNEFILPEEEPIEGNVSAVDPYLDKMEEQRILNRLKQGDESAWCVLGVEAVWKSHRGVAYLGAYIFPEGNTGEENKEFAREDYNQLRKEALENLNYDLQQKANVPEEILELVVDCHII